MKIKATGYRNGERMTVEATGGQNIKYTFNGKADYRLQIDVEELIESGFMIGGTYLPKTMPMKIYAVLYGGFFDTTPTEIEVEGMDEEIPTPAGEDAIY